MPTYRHIYENNSATMVVAKRSAGVITKVKSKGMCNIYTFTECE